MINDYLYNNEKQYHYKQTNRKMIRALYKSNDCYIKKYQNSI